jgi:5-hmdU DNA kinase, helical domain
MGVPVPRPAVLETYWRFAAERQRIFERRLQGEEPPWTTDPILSEYRFCNVFRASDRVSQRLIEVAYASDDFSAEDLFLRVVLFRLFSRVSTWDLIEDGLGEVRAATLDSEAVGDLLDEALAEGRRLYTAAFILAPGTAFGHARKHRNHIRLVTAMLEAELPARIVAASGLREVYELLIAWPMIGPFMAYQLAIDLNYTPLTDFDEDEFTVPGPGAMRGIEKVFESRGDLAPAELVHWLVDNQDRLSAEFSMEPPKLFGRRVHAIDAQNLLCEVDKYCRVAFPELDSNRTRIKQRFRPDPEPLALFFPPKWKLGPCR